jgi:hypothetical protein
MYGKTEMLSTEASWYIDIIYGTTEMLSSEASWYIVIM